MGDERSNGNGKVDKTRNKNKRAQGGNARWETKGTRFKKGGEKTETGMRKTKHLEQNWKWRLREEETNGHEYLAPITFADVFFL